MGKKVWVLLLAVTMIMASCKKDSVSVDKFSAKIGGKSWSANLLRVVNLTGDVFLITGTSALGAVVEITVYGKTEGTYELNATEQKCLAIYKKSGLSTSPDDFFTSLSGKVTLTKVDLVNKKVSGTFDFSCKQMKLSSVFETLSISNGVFNDLDIIVTPM